jgi:HEAT repeat protein
MVVPALTKALSDTNWFTRLIAAIALPQFGTDALQAVPALVQSLKDPTTDVRTSATDVLTHIDPVAAARAGVDTNRLSPAKAGRRPSD